MKKLIALSLLLFIIGCDKDSPTAGEDIHPLVGTWAITQIIDVGGDPYQSLTLEGVSTVTRIPDDANNETFIFNANGTYSFEAEINSVYSYSGNATSSSGNGTWSTTDNYITLEPSAQSGQPFGLFYWYPPYTIIQSYSVSGGILTMIYPHTTDISAGPTIYPMGTIQTYQKQ